jgi:hypothetical protein
MPVRKRIIVRGRVRKPPKEGWSWIDRRFLRERAPSLSRDAILLYFFLVAVSDKIGLSYYSDTTIAARLRMEEVAVADARDELEERDLVAYEPPLYQVLSIESPASFHRHSRPTVIGEILAELSENRSRRALGSK